MTSIQLAEAPASVRAIQTRHLPPQPRCRLIQHSLKAGASFERHGSASPSSVEALSGEGRLQVGGESTVLRPGLTSALAPGQACRISADSDLVLLVREHLAPGTPC